MAQAYSNPERASDPHALPDVEVFYISTKEIMSGRAPLDFSECSSSIIDAKAYAGWYYWFCFPGCLPDSDPIGPFETEEAALADAQSHND